MALKGQIIAEGARYEIQVRAAYKGIGNQEYQDQGTQQDNQGRYVWRHAGEATADSPMSALVAVLERNAINGIPGIGIAIYPLLTEEKANYTVFDVGADVGANYYRVEEAL